MRTLFAVSLPTSYRAAAGPPCRTEFLILFQAVQAQGPPVNVDSILRANASSNAFFESSVSIGILAANLAVGAVLAIILQWHYRRYATTLSNKEQFARVFPFILLTTLLIITIVKSSLALSLGLVGALSIVRFRTPIKEPEELAYLFICIAVGLGLGANQTITTVAATGFILIMGAILNFRRKSASNNLYLSVNWEDGSTDPGDRLETLNAILARHVVKSDLRRVDSRAGVLEVNYLVEFSSAQDVTKLVARLNRNNERIGVTLIDQGRLPSL